MLGITDNHFCLVELTFQWEWEKGYSNKIKYSRVRGCWGAGRGGVYSGKAKAGFKEKVALKQRPEELRV